MYQVLSNLLLVWIFCFIFFFTYFIHQFFNNYYFYCFMITFVIIFDVLLDNKYDYLIIDVYKDNIYSLKMIIFNNIH